MQILTEQSRRIAALMVFCVVFAAPLLGAAKELNYGCSTPSLEVAFWLPAQGRYVGPDLEVGGSRAVSRLERNGEPLAVSTPGSCVMKFIASRLTSGSAFT